MNRLLRCASSRAAFAVIATLTLASRPVHASIPDAEIQNRVNQGGVGMISGVYGHADFGLSDRSAVGLYAGVDPNDVYFADFESGDDRFDSDAVVGGHYMYQFLEAEENAPNISGIFGAFANRGGLRPELGIALSYPFSSRWRGRANIVYGPSWGFEAAYQFNRQVEGTIGITGMGLIGVGFRF